MSDTTKTIGERMREGQDQALKRTAIIAGMLVYLGMVIYSGVHNWRLLTAGVAPEMVIWAALGVIALEISAVFLPLALHFWTHSPMQRIAAFTFYAVDLALIFLNVVLDYGVMAQTATIPGWLQMYLFYCAPATPVIAGLGWSVLFLLDPSQRERSMVETLRAATREALAERIAQRARLADVGDMVDATAENMARDIVRQTLGAAAANFTPGNMIDGWAKDAKPSTNGHKTASVYNAEGDTVTVGNPTTRQGEGGAK